MIVSTRMRNQDQIENYFCCTERSKFSEEVKEVVFVDGVEERSGPRAMSSFAPCSEEEMELWGPDVG